MHPLTIVRQVKEIGSTRPDSFRSRILCSATELERSLMSERVRARVKAAKKRGVTFGRKPKLTPQQIDYARRLIDAGERREDVAALPKVTAPRSIGRSRGKLRLGVAGDLRGMPCFSRSMSTELMMSCISCPAYFRGPTTMCLTERVAALRRPSGTSAYAVGGESRSAGAFLTTDSYSTVLASSNWRQ